MQQIPTFGCEYQRILSRMADVPNKFGEGYVRGGRAKEVSGLVEGFLYSDSGQLFATT